jgi:hypothetical protein
MPYVAGFEDFARAYLAHEHMSRYEKCAAHAGYEAPAQFAEETRAAAKNVPWAIVTSVIATALCGGLHIASLLFSVQVGAMPATEAGLSLNLQAMGCKRLCPPAPRACASQGFKWHYRLTNTLCRCWHVRLHQSA